VERDDEDSADEPRDVNSAIAVLQAKVRLLTYLFKHELVSKHEFEPVKLIAFGFAGLIITSVIVAVLSYVLRKG
jgi:hypothetical protein